MILYTPIGTVTLGSIEGTLICEFGSHPYDEEPNATLAKQMTSYFNGKFTDSFDAPLAEGPTFSRKCWAACRTIPYGTTVSYAQLATMAGSPKAARAAGQAMRNNPTPIITPCHRVIASTGKLHGFAGTTKPNSKELKQKEFLLKLERSTIDA